MTRDEHLARCKQRALDEMNFSARPQDGIVSMLSDLRKHPETANHVGGKMAVALMMAGHLTQRQEVIDYINGFN